MTFEGGVRCRDCKKDFFIKDETEYIASYCPGCRKLVVLYKINPAILSKKGDEKAVFLSSDQKSKCRKCGNLVTMKNSNDYFSIRCVSCGFGIVYRMPTHRGIGRYLSKEEFDKNIYWTSGKRQADREARDEQFKKG